MLQSYRRAQEWTGPAALRGRDQERGGAVHGLAIDKRIREVGVTRIREKSLRQTRRMMDRADALGFRVNTPREDDRRGGTVCIDFDGAEGVSKELIRRGILLDYRPKCGIRASPHFYTTDDEVERLFEEIESIRAGK